MQVYHVVKKELKKIKPPYEFMNGDVYVVETDDTLWIWIGSKSYADEKAVGAWNAKKIEEKNRRLDIKTVNEGTVPKEFKELLNYTVIEGDTSGFLEKINPKEVIDYRLLRVKQCDVGKVETEEVSLDIKSFKSDDVFILDGWDLIYVWIGKDSQVKEKYEGGRIGRELDVERKRVPLIYTIDEGNEPPNFKEFIKDLAEKDKVIEQRKKEKAREAKIKGKKWWQFWK